MGMPCRSRNLQLITIITIIILVIASMDAFRWSIAATCGSKMPCRDGSCCSQYGFCGNTTGFCGNGCVNLCKSSNSSSSTSKGNGISEVDVSDAITDKIFKQFFYAYIQPKCPAYGFYNLSSFLTAAATFPSFGTSGGFISSRRELAAFFAYASQVTAGCVGSLCSTRSKLMGILMPLALGGMVILVLGFLGLKILRQQWCNGETGGDKTVKLEKIQCLAGTPINFPYASLEYATKSFTAVIGQGGFGVVYKGVLRSGEAIAVKVLNESMHTERQFLREIESLGKLHHVNVVRLLGFCIEKSKKILVYEYISNSSLEKHLFDGSNNNEEMESVLSWEKRYEIALGIARGLSYIHEECLHKIIHRDLKPQNILLDDVFCPKISDFGLAKIIKREESKVVSGLKGTPGYMAPEFWAERRGELSTKFDVYSFGMVALELVSGRRNFKEDIPSEQAFFPEWAFANFSSPSSIIDYRIASQANLSQVQVLVHVAFWCIQEDPSLRPSMSRVIQYLEGIVDVPMNPPKPFQDVTPGSSMSTT